MTTKKPSLTKQIAEVLGTDDKREQLKRVENLLKAAGAPTVALTIFFDGNDIDLSVLGARLSGDQVKAVLSMAQDKITEAQVKAKIEAETLSEGEPEEVEPPPK